MRISDWSSDVCSSDLDEEALVHRAHDVLAAAETHEVSADDRGDDAHAAHQERQRHQRKQHIARTLQQQRDRKSDVQGKSVSVRVDLGGRRIIKKKKTQLYNNKTTAYLQE